VKHLLHNLLTHLPSRHRRRQWKYVSPRRRVLGLSMLALILLLLYAGWYLTHDSRIRREAKLALEGLTGADVDVDTADFSVFEGVRLRGVRVRIRDDASPFHFFTAREVVLRYDPWTLLSERTLRPTEIVCIEPVINLEHDEDTGVSNAERLSRKAAARVDGPRDGPLPAIRLTNGLLRSRVKQGRQRSIVAEEPIDCTFEPIGPQGYAVKVFGPHGGETDAMWASFDLDLATGRLRDVEFTGTHRLFQLLPPRYHDWLQRYSVAGDFRLVREGYTDADRDRYEIELWDFSLQLPEQEGGLVLRKVTGRLRFSPEGVVLNDVEGIVPQANNARFKLQGEYSGLKKDSPFIVTVSIEDFSLPEEARGEIGKIVDFMRRHFAPEGTATLTLSYQRLADGRFVVAGELQPQGIRMKPDWFPLQVEDVRGRVTFDEKKSYTLNLRVRVPEGPNGDGGTATVTGRIRHPEPDGRSLYDMTVRAEDIAFSENLREALPERFASMWGMLNPEGVCDARVRVNRHAADKSKDIEIDLLLKGKASARYHRFPYPLVNLTGRIGFRDDDVTIPLVESERGKALVAIRGGASGLGSGEPTVGLQIEAVRVPLDDALRQALPERIRAFIARLNASGRAGRARADITQEPGKPLAWSVTADLAAMALEHEDFPYTVTDAGGELRISQNRARLRKLQGRHGDATVQIDATMSLDEDRPQYAATLRGENVTLDKAFHDALPDSAREAWASLRPAGRADLTLHLQDRDGDGATDGDYRLIINAREMAIQYRDFPYPFSGIRGRAVVTPGRIALQDMVARNGRMTATLNGTIDTRHAGTDVALAISIKEMSINKELLDAIPSDLVPLVKRFRPGGRMNAEISKLLIARRPAAEDAPREDPGTLSRRRPRKAAAAGPQVRWVAEGSLAFRDVAFDIGFGSRELTGILSGKAGQEDDDLGANADVRLEELELGKHVICDARGRIMKLPNSDVLRIDRIEARAHDGVLVGQASVRLTDPVQYKLSMEFEDVDLAKLFNAGEPDRSKWIDVQGRVAGPLVLSATAGANPTRQATGELVISDAKLYKLPIILGALQIIYLQLPGDGAFNQGTVKYVLRNNTLTFREIYLSGKAISVLGAGSYDLKKDRLKLTFLTGPPGKLQRLDELTEDVLRALSNTLVEIRVTGPLKKPKMDTVPLSPLDTILRRLLSPSLQPQ
jgi:hypothetical protein